MGFSNFFKARTITVHHLNHLQCATPEPLHLTPEP